MNKETEQIPGYILDWLDTRDFASLDAGEKEEVLKYLEPSEYDNMRECSLDLHSLGLQYEPGREEEIRENLLERFSLLHATPQTMPDEGKVIRMPLIQYLRRVAAVITLFGAGWLACYLVQFRKSNSQPEAIGGDTVYLEPAPVRIFDTIYMERNSKTAPAKSPEAGQEKHIDMRDATSLVLPYRQSVASVRDQVGHVRESEYSISTNL